LSGRLIRRRWLPRGSQAFYKTIDVPEICVLHCMKCPPRHRRPCFKLVSHNDPGILRKVLHKEPQVWSVRRAPGTAPTGDISSQPLLLRNFGLSGDPPLCVTIVAPRYYHKISACKDRGFPLRRLFGKGGVRIEKEYCEHTNEEPRCLFSHILLLSDTKQTRLIRSS